MSNEDPIQPWLFPPEDGSTAEIRVDLTVFLPRAGMRSQFGQIIRTWPQGLWISGGTQVVPVDDGWLEATVARASAVLGAARSVWSPF